MHFQNLSITAQIFCIYPRFTGLYAIRNFVDQIKGFLFFNHRFLDVIKIKCDVVGNTIITVLLTSNTGVKIRHDI